MVSVSGWLLCGCNEESLPHHIDNIEEAYALIRELEPSSPQEYILKAVANTVVGQEQGSVSTHMYIRMQREGNRERSSLCNPAA